MGNYKVSFFRKYSSFFADDESLSLLYKVTKRSGEVNILC